MDCVLEVYEFLQFKGNNVTVLSMCFTIINSPKHQITVNNTLLMISTKSKLNQESNCKIQLKQYLTTKCPPNIISLFYHITFFHKRNIFKNSRNHFNPICNKSNSIILSDENLNESKSLIYFWRVFGCILIFRLTSGSIQNRLKIMCTGNARFFWYLISFLFIVLLSSFNATFHSISI